MDTFRFNQRVRVDAGKQTELAGRVVGTGWMNRGDGLHPCYLVELDGHITLPNGGVVSTLPVHVDNVSEEQPEGVGHDRR